MNHSAVLSDLTHDLGGKLCYHPCFICKESEVQLAQGQQAQIAESGFNLRLIDSITHFVKCLSL